MQRRPTLTLARENRARGDGGGDAEVPRALADIGTGSVNSRGQLISLVWSALP